MRFTTRLFPLMMLNAAVICFSCLGQPRSPTLDERVAALIDPLLNSTTEQQALIDLEALGCPAVPAIIRQMDNRQPLPIARLSLKNNHPGAFEGIRHYAPQQVVDALAAILNQVTGQHFGFIYNGGSDEERAKTIDGWRQFLLKTPTTKLCQGS